MGSMRNAVCDHVFVDDWHHRPKFYYYLCKRVIAELHSK